MPTIYVVGPVYPINPLVPESAFAAVLYDVIKIAGRQSSFEISLPEADEYLYRAEPAIFFGEISQRIKRADGVISIVSLGGEGAAGVEATVASYLGKKQLIVASPHVRVSRLILGLPGVSRAVIFKNRQELMTSVVQFLNDLNASRFSHR